MANQAAPERWKSIVTGLIGGGAAGLTGIGGGAVMVPLLTGVLRLTQHQAHATSLAIVIFAAASAAVQYIVRDQVDWGLIVALAIGGVIGAQIGAGTMNNLPERRLRMVFAVFLIFVGARLVIWG